MKAPQQTRLQVHVWTAPATERRAAERCVAASLERDGEYLLTLFTNPDREQWNLSAWVDATHCGVPRGSRGVRWLSLSETAAKEALQALFEPLDFSRGEASP